MSKAQEPGERITATSAMEQHGQSILAAILLSLLLWNATTTYGTKLEVTAMRANLDATLEAQRLQIAGLSGEVSTARSAIQSHETRITVMEREQARDAIRRETKQERDQ